MPMREAPAARRLGPTAANASAIASFGASDASGASWAASGDGSDSGDAASASAGDVVVGASNSTTAAANATAVPSVKNATSATNSSDYGEDSASASSDADVMYRRTQGSCAYYPVSTAGCRAPRSCYDCLNYDVAPERSGCMVDADGACTSVSGNYNWTRDFHYAVAANAVGSLSLSDGDDTTGLQFAAANATYCSASDAKCSVCRHKLFTDEQRTTGLFCLGSDGCVCIAMCEQSDWAALVGGSSCSSSTAGTVTSATTNSSITSGSRTDETTNTGESSGGGSSYDAALFWEVALSVIAALAMVSAVVAYLSIRHRQQYDRESPDQRPDSLAASLFHRRNGRGRRRGSRPSTSSLRSTMPTFPTSDRRSRDNGSQADGLALDLTGWQAMRQELDEKDTLRAANANGIRRVVMSPFIPLGSDALSLSPRTATSVSTAAGRRFTVVSFFSPSSLASPSDAMPFTDEEDCFDGLVTPPAGSRMVL